jgi:hypothetical protein
MALRSRLNAGAGQARACPAGSTWQSKPADAEQIWEAALNADKVKGRPEMTKTNPTAGEFAGLQAEVKVAERVCSNARGSKEEEAAGQRVTAASKAILSARPTDPSVMAAQLRFLVAESVVDADARGALEHIAEQLEAMSGGIVLSADAAAQIRAALLAVLEHTGGGVEAEDDPELSPGIGLYAQESERQLRAAYELLNVATPPAGGTTV